MFKIVDGREYFYQWDLDRQIAVEDSSIVEVHFCNRTDECSLVVDVIDGIANVPNIILQNSFDVRVFGYDGKATLHEKTFKVRPRTQPSDYVYTETAIKSIEELLAAAEQVTITANELYEYVEENKLAFTDDGEGNVNLEGIETELGDLENYYTKEETDALIENIEINGVDLSGYAKKEDIPDVSDFISEIPAEYVTESELEAKGYLTEHIDISGKADKVHKHSMADITDYVAPEIPSIEGLATEKYVDDAIANIEIPEPEPVDLSNYYTKEEVNTNYSDAKEVFYFDFSGVFSGRDATEEETKVLNRLKNGENLTVYVRCATNREIYAVADIRRVNSSSFDFKLHYTFLADTNVTEVIEYNAYLLQNSPVWRITRDSAKTYTFATEKWVQDQGYITDHQSLEGYATKDYVDSLFEGIATAEGGSY